MGDGVPDYSLLWLSEPDFSPAQKAHPAFSVSEYDALQGKLRMLGVEVTDDNSIPGLRRCYVHDPWGTGSSSSTLD